MNKERVGQFYDVLWQEYTPNLSASKRHWNTFFQAPGVKGKRVLDAGCGPGVFSLIFAQKEASCVIGVDISQESLKAAQRLRKSSRLRAIELIRNDVLSLCFKNESFDIVWAWGTVHHTTDPYQGLSELIRVLRPGGSLLLAVYRKTSLTSLHELLRKILIRTPKFSWLLLAKLLSHVLSPITALFKKREKSRQGETLEELVLDWFFVPIKHFFHPKEVQSFLEANGLTIETFVPYSGRFNSSSNFIFKARKRFSIQRDASEKRTLTSQD